MEAIALQPRPLYGIGTVARLTGIKPDTLRIWERRYRLGASHKSASGRRQYTQGDVEHLQLVAALVSRGTRIGEIANSERRTLEVLLRTRDSAAARALPAAKPRILFVGKRLCEWLEDHQGCLVNVDALLAHCPMQEVGEDLLSDVGQVDGLVVDCGGLSHAALEALTALAASLGTENVVALHQCGNSRLLDLLGDRGYAAGEFPPDSAFIAFQLSRIAAQATASAGSGDLGDLVQVRPRLFSDDELSLARKLDAALDCECPRHLGELIESLATFEEYSSSCSVENWRDAAVHACIYAYAGQARWLMEKALSLVLEAHASEGVETAAAPPAQMTG